MRLTTKTRALAAVAALALGLGLAGCGGGGGGGGSTPSSTTLSGTVSKGLFLNADVKVYDATVGETGTPLYTGSTGASDGKYAFELPEGFSKPLLIIVSAKAGGVSTTLDEISGSTVMPEGFRLCAVIPSEAIVGTTVTGHVTPYTNLMCEVAKNHIGTSNADAAINQARNAVNQATGNMDPLSTDPLGPIPTVQHAMVSNIGICAEATDDAARIQCAVNVLATLIEPIPVDAVPGDGLTLAINQDVAAALADSAANLPMDSVASNTGLPKTELESQQPQLIAQYDNLGGNSDLTIPDSATATALQQAKLFFASLRSGILPYANSAGSGFLDTQGSKLSDELNALNDVTLNGLEVVVNIADWAVILMEGEQPNECNGSSFPAVCTVGTVTVNLIRSGDTVTWNINGANLTGTAVFSNSNSRVTMNGYVPGMSSNATKAKVGNPGGTDSDAEPLVIALEDKGDDVYKFTLQGSVKDLNNCDVNGNNCTPVMKLAFASGSQLTVHDTEDVADFDPSKMSTSLTGIFVTPNYRFVGKLAASNLQANGPLLIGGTASFTGTVNGVGLTSLDNDTGNNFDILVGKLEAQIDGKPLGTWSYNSEVPDSASNYQKSSLTFTGTTFKSASDPGLKLVFTLGWDWDTAGNWYRESLSVAYNDYNKGISLSGQTSRMDDDDLTPVSLTLSDGNGIQVVWLQGSPSIVKKGNLELATIDGGRITYADGTYESIL